ncbi:MAG: ABC transporter permease [Gracilibacteraceae bacterium]|jgi:ABC-type dipeptide/oligopeptide/nickel transport system permease component|nr:ABC transporter permease [Gracilibacteraceae bacterium]
MISKTRKSTEEKPAAPKPAAPKPAARKPAKNRYVLLRALSYIPVLFGVTVLVFVLMRAAPGDAAYMLLTEHGKDVTRENLAQTRTELLLDAPVWKQYAAWVAAAAKLDFGRSAINGREALPQFVAHLAYTVRLALPAIAVMLFIALPCGVIAAARAGGAFDAAARAATVLILSIPGFCAGLALLYLFGVKLALLPTFGAGGWRHMILPAATLAAGAGAGYARFIRAAVLEQLSADYIKAGLARGVRPGRLVNRAALRQALPAIVTSVSMTLGLLLGGSAVIETVFSWPGVGKFLVDAVSKRDYAVVQCCVLLFGVFFVTLNFAAEIISMLLDPKTRRGKGDAA